jgi:hypothetical protein
MWNILTLNYCTICGFHRQMSHQWELKPDECKSKKYNIMNSNKTQMKNPSNISVIPWLRFNDIFTETFQKRWWMSDACLTPSDFYSSCIVGRTNSFLWANDVRFELDQQSFILVVSTRFNYNARAHMSLRWEAYFNT